MSLDLVALDPFAPILPAALLPTPPDAPHPTAPDALFPHPPGPLLPHPPSPRSAAASPRLELATLADIVTGLAVAEELWRPHVEHHPDERTRVRLLATPAYEVWLLGWAPGQSAGLHDHGGASGAFVVVDGELVETHAGPAPRTLRQRRLGVGDLVAVEPGAVHDVANRSAALATSIHAYSRPLRSMGFYDDATAGIVGHRVRTVWVDDTPARLSA